MFRPRIVAVRHAEVRVEQPKAPVDAVAAL